MLRNDSNVLNVSLSACSGSLVQERMMMALARCTLTRTRSPITNGDPLRKTTRVPRRCLTGSCKSNSSSICALSLCAKTATTPPPSLSFALQISSMMWEVFSVHPRIKVWSFSIIRLLPCRRLSIFSRIMSTVRPNTLAKNKMPASVMEALTTRSDKSKFTAWVPGSAMKVHADQTPSKNALTVIGSLGSETSQHLQMAAHMAPPVKTWRIPQSAKATKTRQRFARMRSKV
mmetsp:Transcript_81317/g.204609  ORF Transcript_81317/g.204609 Transcript_81317/m.204609 type:complete len:231 (-) Transcript_81317:318-1010(-)